MSTSRWSDSKSTISKLYGTVYSTYELPGTRIYRDNEIHHGLVSIADGSSPGKPARLELTNDALIIQVPLAIANEIFEAKDQAGFVGENARLVALSKHPETGFGFAIKGGGSGTCRAPIVISKVWRDQENVERYKQLLVGDTIIELNGIAVENKSHDEVVQMLKDAGDKVQLKLKHQKDIASHLLRGSNPMSRAGSTDRRIDTGTMNSMTSYHQSMQIYGTIEAPRGWKTLSKIALPMAYTTRYLWGTDKIRSNAFEVRAVDGTSSGPIFCEDDKVVDLWTQYISKNIVRLNNKSIKLSNKFLHPDELIVYLGWVCEKADDTNNLAATGANKEFWQSWQPKFLILKGSDVCLFESPPLNTEDLSKCIVSYRIVETRFKDVKEFEVRDQRKFVFCLETCTGATHYFSLESKPQLDQLRSAWHRSIYYTVNRLQSKTFACNVEDRPSGLVLDIKHGIGLYDIHRKKYIWRYKFPVLQSSCDDGKMRLRLVFRNRTASIDPHIVDLDCSDLYPLVYTLHSFLLARIISVDPDFIEINKF